MNHLMRYYNQNRKKIWGTLIIIASAFLLLQLVNYFYKISVEKRQQVEKLPETSENISTDTTKITTDNSVVTGKKLDDDKLKSETAVIKDFVSYCNEKELQKAYDLLTEECKEQMYHTLEAFEQAYYNDVFNGEKKIASVENWVNNTYKVRIADDMLEKGKSNDGYAKQDYMTIQEVNGENKLNINSYIGYTKIDKTTKQDGFTVEVVSKNTYMKEEEYTLKVTNHTKNRMVLDQRNDVKSLYIEDSKGSKHSSYSHELTEPNLTVPARQTKTITIKFYSSYIATKKIKRIVFSDALIYNDLENREIQLQAKI